MQTSGSIACLFIFVLMRNNPSYIHFFLLSQAVQVDKVLASQKAAEITQKHTVNWALLYFLAELHTVRPQLHRLLKQLPAGRVPSNIIDQLHTDYRQNLYLQLQNTSEYLQVQELLRTAGVEAISFKGFSLANSFYDDPAERESVDVDLYIRASDLEKVKMLMFQRGYKAEEPFGKLSNDYVLAQLCEYNFDKYAGDTRIFHFEFHWRVSLTVFGMNITMDDLREQVVEDQIQQRSTRSFSASAHLLLTILHHAGKDQFANLKQVLDIANILQKEEQIDWLWVTHTAKRLHAETLLFVAIRLAAKITGCTIPEAMEKKVKSAFIERLTGDRTLNLSNKTTRLESLPSKFGNFYFQLRSRNDLALQAKIIVHEIRHSVIPSLIPKKMHRFFINKKIRQAASHER